LDCEKALRMNEKFGKAYNRLSKCQLARGDISEAKKTLEKAIELEPSNK
jgi:tetratricopeptide (TPR) repeat protein